MMSNANIIPNEDVTSCGQLDTKSMAFTIFGGSWNKEKNNEYPPNRTPAFTNAATMISKVLVYVAANVRLIHRLSCLIL